jgi:hypothetical protein
MSTTLRIVVDPSKPGSQELMRYLAQQLRALEIGELEEKREKAPPGTLAEPLMTVILVLKLSYWSVQVGLAVWELIKEARSKCGAEKGIPQSEVPDIHVMKEQGGQSTTLKTSAKKEDVDAFLGDSDKKGLQP